jgi:hypothetical protein
MNVCDPNIKYEDLKKRVEQNVGRPMNLSRKQICNLYANIQQDKLLLPPLVLSHDRTYMLDRKSPLTQADYERLFDKSTLKAQIKRLATKVGALVDEKNTKDELREAIFARLRNMGVREPVRLAPGKPKPRKAVSAPVFVNNVNRRNNVNANANNVNRRNNTNANANRRNNTNANVNRRNNANVNANNVNRRNNVNVNVNANRRNLNNRRSVFKPGFVPNFIKNRNRNTNVRESVGSAPTPRLPPMRAPEPSAVRENNGRPPVVAAPRNRENNGRRPVLRPPVMPTRPSAAPVVSERNAAESREDKKKLVERKELQKHLNGLRNLSQADVNAYINSLAQNRSTLKDIKMKSKIQNEVYKKKKGEILNKLKEYDDKLSLTAKNSFKSRLNSVARGKNQSYLNDIQKELLKSVQNRKNIEKKSEFRKELLGLTGENLNAKYKELYEKANTNNRQLLDIVYNAQKTRRPTVNTNAATRTMKEVTAMLNADRVRRQQREITNAISQLKTQYVRATREGNASVANNAQSKITEQLTKRVTILEEQLSKAENLSKRTGDPKFEEQVEIIKKEVKTAESVAENMENELERANTQAKKRRRMNVENSARLERAAARVANRQEMERRRKFAKTLGISSSYVNAYLQDMGIENISKMIRKNFNNKLEQDKKLSAVSGRSLTYSNRFLYENMLKKAQARKNVSNLASRLGVDERYINAYKNDHSGSTNGIENKVAKDKVVSNLIGSRRPVYIKNSEYNGRLNKAKNASLQRKIAELAKEVKVSPSYIKNYMAAGKNIENKNALMNKVAKDRALAQTEQKRTGIRQKLLGNKVEFVPDGEEYNTRMKAAQNAMKLKALNIPKNFVNQYLKNTGKTINDLNNVDEYKNLANKYERAKKVAELSGTEVNYNRSSPALAEEATLLNVLARDAKTTKNFVMKYINDAKMSVKNFVADTKKVRELQRTVEIMRDTGMKQVWLNTYLRAEKKNSILNVNVNVMKKKFAKSKEVSVAEKRGDVPFLTDAQLNAALRNIDVKKVQNFVGKGKNIDEYLTNNKKAVREAYLNKNTGRVNLNAVKKNIETSKRLAKEEKASEKRGKKQTEERVKRLAKEYGMSDNKVREVNDTRNLNRNALLLKKYNANEQYLKNYQNARPGKVLSEDKLKRDVALSKYKGASDTVFVPKKEQDILLRKILDDQTRKYATNAGLIKRFKEIKQIIGEILVKDRVKEDALLSEPEKYKARIEATLRARFLNTVNTINKLPYLERNKKNNFIKQIKEGGNVATLLNKARTANKQAQEQGFKRAVVTKADERTIDRLTFINSKKRQEIKNKLRETTNNATKQKIIANAKILNEVGETESKIMRISGLSREDKKDYIKVAGGDLEQLKKVLVIATAAAKFVKEGNSDAVNKLAFSEGTLGASIKNKTLNQVKANVQKVRNAVEAKKKAEAEAAAAKKAEEAARKRAEANAAKRKAEEEAARKKAEEEAAKRKAEAEAKKAEEVAKKKAEAEAKKAEEAAKKAEGPVSRGRAIFERMSAAASAALKGEDESSNSNNSTETGFGGRRQQPRRGRQPQRENSQSSVNSLN